jgi:S1-C subfamily serine protease
VLLGAGVTFSTNYFGLRNPQNTATFGATDSSKVLAQTPPTSNLLLNQNSNFITAVVEKVGPAVVRIDSSRTVTSRVPKAFITRFFDNFLAMNSQPGHNSELKRVRVQDLLSAIMVRF